MYERLIRGRSGLIRSSGLCHAARSGFTCSIGNARVYVCDAAHNIAQGREKLEPVRQVKRKIEKKRKREKVRSETVTVR